MSNGRIAKLDSERRIIYGVAAEADVLDRQGDIIPAEELERAAVAAMEKGISAGHQHQRTHGVGRVVASFPLTAEIAKALGIDTFGKSYWLVGMKVDDDAIWQKVKSGELRGFSIGGSGVRTKQNG